MRLLASFQFDALPQNRKVGGDPLRGLVPTAVPRVMLVDVRAGLAVDIGEEHLAAQRKRLELQGVLDLAVLIPIVGHRVSVAIRPGAVKNSTPGVDDGRRYGPSMLSAVPSPTPPPAGLLATDVQIWAASATTGAACIALAVAVISLLQRRGDREREAGRERSRARAQARLVTLASNLDLKKRQAPATSVLRFLAVNNYGDRAIVEVVGEAWAGDADIAAAPTFSEGPQVLPAGGDQLFILYLADRQEPVPGLAAWRLRWMDADGQRWCLDQQPQDTPVEYTGQPPRPYRSPRG